MSDNSRPRRPVVGSRHATSRPRKVAGQRVGDVVSTSSTTEEATTEEVSTSSTTEDGGSTTEAVSTSSTTEVVSTSSTTEEGTSVRTTVALVVLVVVLIAVAAFQVFYLLDDDEPAPSAQRPVVTGELTHRAAVEAAARSTEQILSTSYQNYDEQVDQATTKMTDAFAKEYRQTAEGIKDQFVAAHTQLQVKAVAQGVVRASSDEAEALLFLNHYIQKDGPDGKPTTSYAQYRALVTVVHTDQGWLVSDIKTQ
jgi:Mce-associated membrane protein